MTVVVKTNPTLVDGNDWNTTTYSPSSVVPNAGGTTSQFNVVSGAVILNNGVAISGDRGIVFPDGLDLARQNPLIQAGDTQITYDSTTTSSTSAIDVLSETITIGTASGVTGASVIPMSIRITFDGYITNSTNGSGGVWSIYKNGVYQTAGFLTTSWTTYTSDIEVNFGDVITINVAGRTYTYVSSTDKNGNPTYTTVYYTGSIRYVRSRALNLDFQTTYPNLVTRS